MTRPLLPTSDRILQVAAEIFASEGFKSTTIRRIAQAAQVNTAAIHYHFGDKEGLYATVIEHVFREAFSKFPSRLNIDENAPPNQQLRGFIKAMFARLLSRDGIAGQPSRGKLIARELLEPTPAFEPVLDTYMRPHRDLLLSILRAILKMDAIKAELLMPCALSIIAQCIYYALAGPVIKRMAGEHILDEENLDTLAEFVWMFSLGGLERMRSQSMSVDSPTD